MAFLRRKKIIRPKNQLGLALFQYDNIINNELKTIIKKITYGKSVNPERANLIFKRIEYRLNGILEDISKENLKVDYRSDKIRYMIIDMVEKLKNLFNKAKSHEFNAEKIKNDKNLLNMDQIISMRKDLKSNMKDIESDYL